MARRIVVSILALGLLIAPVSALGQEMVMGPVGYVEHPTYGTILTDNAGLTLYTWASDTQGAGTSACYEACAGAWPPAVVDELTAGTMMTMMPMGLGAIVRTDGTYQLTHNGWPLYYFVRDVAVGDANGEGSMGFGGRWSVVPVDPMMGM
jgi:predicted lipoprotein with Yx(FWY)xxD motif